MRHVQRSRLIRLIGAAALYIWAFTTCRMVEQNGDSVYLALKTGVPPQTAAEIFAQEEDPVGCCFWGEDAQTVFCPATAQTAQVTRVYLEGNPELLGMGTLAWQDGCLIDEQTAQALFGTGQCGAQVLYWNDRAYPVLGTISALRPTVVMAALEGDLLSRCVLALPAENGKSLGEQFLLRFGLQGEILDFFPLRALMRNLLLLVPGALLLRLCGYLRKRWKKALVLTLGAVILWKGLVIPPEMIPSRWSDFSFWGSLWDSQKENLRYILFTPLGGRQLQILLNMVKSMIGSILAALLLQKKYACAERVSVGRCTYDRFRFNNVR